METTNPTTTPANSALTPNSVVDNDVCVGWIQAQSILLAKNGSPYLKVDIRISDRLNDPKRPQGSTTPFSPPFDQSVTVFLSESEGHPWDEKDLERFAENLAGLGFVGSDIQVLEPSHPQHAAQGDLRGKRVFLRTYTNAKDQRVWVVKHFKPFEQKPAGANVLKQAQRAISARLEEALKKVREPFKPQA